MCAAVLWVSPVELCSAPEALRHSRSELSFASEELRRAEFVVAPSEPRVDPTGLSAAVGFASFPLELAPLSLPLADLIAESNVTPTGLWVAPSGLGQLGFALTPADLAEFNVAE